MLVFGGVAVNFCKYLHEFTGKNNKNDTKMSLGGDFSSEKGGKSHLHRVCDDLRLRPDCSTGGFGKAQDCHLRRNVGSCSFEGNENPFQNITTKKASRFLDSNAQISVYPVNSKKCVSSILSIVFVAKICPLK